MRPDDVEAVVGMVYALAGYDRARSACRLTSDQLRVALFGPAPGLHGHVAGVGGTVAGCALWFLSFSTWQGVHGARGSAPSVPLVQRHRPRPGPLTDQQ